MRHMLIKLVGTSVENAIKSSFIKKNFPNCIYIFHQLSATGATGVNDWLKCLPLLYVSLKEINSQKSGIAKSRNLWGESGGDGEKDPGYLSFFLYISLCIIFGGCQKARSSIRFVWFIKPLQYRTESKIQFFLVELPFFHEFRVIQSAKRVPARLLSIVYITVREQLIALPSCS